MSAFLEGVIAGYGIAIPVGPIAVLIIGLGTRRGFPRAFFAGLGAALADLIYAGVAAVAGATAAALLMPYEGALRVAGGLVLLVVAVAAAMKTFRPGSESERTASSHVRALTGFLSITLMNPVTLTYFAALILGSAGGVATTATGAMLFVTGAFLASLSWQTSLAVAGAVLGHRMSDRTRVVTGLLGAGVILLLAVRMLFVA
ncbi:MAG: LysE family transporter [Actinobacteria bacterium]|nr:LysE family transporter [Actinomycetota bacterium]